MVEIAFNNKFLDSTNVALLNKASVVLNGLTWTTYKTMMSKVINNRG